MKENRMTYDSTIYNAIQAEWLRVCGDDIRAQPGWSKVIAAFDAIPPLTLKDEDGRFVRVLYDPSMRVHDEYGDPWGPAGGYRIVEDPVQ